MCQEEIREKKLTVFSKLLHSSLKSSLAVGNEKGTNLNHLANLQNRAGFQVVIWG